MAINNDGNTSVEIGNIIRMSQEVTKTARKVPYPVEIIERTFIPSSDVYRRRYTKKAATPSSVEAKLEKQTKFAAKTDNEYKYYKEVGFGSDYEIELNDKDFEVRKIGSFVLDQPIAIKTKNGFTYQQRSIEDFHCVEEVKYTINNKEEAAHLFGVFDGHGDKGRRASKVAEKLPEYIGKALSEGRQLDAETITRAITHAVGKLEEELIKECSNERDGGTTATCALKIGNDIYLINVGDSRAILVKSDDVIQLTEDADPEKERFAQSLKSMGRMIACDKYKVYRSSGYAVARDLGIPFLPAQPKITRIQLGNDSDDIEKGRIYYKYTDYLILASDGLWEVASNKEVGEYVRRMDKAGKSEYEIAKAIVGSAVVGSSKCPGFCGKDDISVVVVKL